MEALSSSSPLSVHSNWVLAPPPSRPGACRFQSRPFRKVVAFHPIRTLLCSDSASTSFNSSLNTDSPPRLVFQRRGSSRRRRIVPISAVFERFTERAIKAVMLSQREARGLGRDMVFTQHLLLGLIAEDRDPKGFLGSGVSIDKAREAVRSIWKVEDGSGSSSGGTGNEATDVPFSISSKRVFEAAVEYSKTMGHKFIAPEHISMGLLTVDDGSAHRVFRRLGIDENELATAAVARLEGELAKDGREPSVSSKGVSEKKSSGSTKSSRKTKDKSALEQFCVDLTARASEGLIDPVIGREKEVRRIIQILCRKTKNNPILLGESGVGKTAIAEGLAISIAQAQVPVFLFTKRVMSLDIGLLMAGAKERGELEARVTSLIREVQKSGDVILFIDEVHTLVGSGSVGRGNKGSGLDISNLLKPALGRGQLQCIASTTLDEYRSQFEKDAALARRFQPVLIKEPNEEDAIQILMGLRERYEAHHHCKFSPEAIHAAVHLSARYIADRFLPDKAIDLIDEAGSRASIKAHRRRREQQTDILSKSPDDYWHEIKSVQALHEMVLSTRLKYNASASSMDDEPGEIILESPSPSISDEEYVSCILENLAQLPLCIHHSQPTTPEFKKFLTTFGCEMNGENTPVKKKKDISVISHPKVVKLVENGAYLGPIVVGPDDIAAVASLWSGIPVQQLTADERSLLVDLEGQLKKRVVGQDEAVSAIARAVKRSRVGIKDPDRPIAAMLFCGPTGVGKTELTKALAASYFGSEGAMLRLDMSEYMERHTVSKLIGSPPGYVGYEEGGMLTEAIRRRPFTVVLLDEIEKAHPDIFNILLQVFEDGHLTDSQGRRVSFKNALLVMTSNVGSSAIAKGGGGNRSFGFFMEDDEESASYTKMKELVVEELKAYFRPELLNRIDEVVVFHPLQKSQMLEILEVMLQEVKGRLISMGVGLEVSESVKDLICREGYDKAYGARPLRRALTQIVEDPLSETILAGGFKPGDTAVIDLDASGNLVVRNRSDNQSVHVSDTTSVL